MSISFSLSASASLWSKYTRSPSYLNKINVGGRAFSKRFNKKVSLFTAHYLSNISVSVRGCRVWLKLCNCNFLLGGPIHHPPPFIRTTLLSPSGASEGILNGAVVEFMWAMLRIQGWSDGFCPCELFQHTSFDQTDYINSGQHHLRVDPVDLSGRKVWTYTASKLWLKCWFTVRSHKCKRFGMACRSAHTIKIKTLIHNKTYACFYVVSCMSY